MEARSQAFAKQVGSHAMGMNSLLSHDVNTLVAVQAVSGHPAPALFFSAQFSKGVDDTSISHALAACSDATLHIALEALRAQKILVWMVSVLVKDQAAAGPKGGALLCTLVLLKIVWGIISLILHIAWLPEPQVELLRGLKEEHTAILKLEVETSNRVRDTGSALMVLIIVAYAGGISVLVCACVHTRALHLCAS
eukprot:1158702-Pelagomonas_calceolata.AAC.3